MSNSTHPDVVATRDHLAQHGVDINDSSNGFFLPTSSKVKNDYGLDSVAHSRVHTNSYKKLVRDRMNSQNSAEVIIHELNNISNELLNGKFGH